MKQNRPDSFPPYPPDDHHSSDDVYLREGGAYTVLPDNSILITANMHSETGFPSSHQLKSYVASNSRLKLAARAVLSADAGLLVIFSFFISLFCLVRAAD